MELLWKEIRRHVTDLVRELDRLIEQIHQVAENQSSLLKTDDEHNRSQDELNHAHSLVMNIATIAKTDITIHCASAVNEDEFWTINLDHKIVRVKSSKGVRLLAVLIDNPGRQFHVMDLERHERKDPPQGVNSSLRSSDAGPVLDESARTSYKVRLRDLRDELEEAQRFNDPFRASKIQEEMAILTKELARAFGLHGDSRMAISDAERARVRVTLAIKGAIGKISRYEPALGWHLATTVKTGSFCSYLPAPMPNHDNGLQDTDT